MIVVTGPRGSEMHLLHELLIDREIPSCCVPSLAGPLGELVVGHADAVMVMYRDEAEAAAAMVAAGIVPDLATGITEQRASWEAIHHGDLWDADTPSLYVSHHRLTHNREGAEARIDAWLEWVKSL